MEAPHAGQSQASAPSPVRCAPAAPDRPVWPVVVGVVSIVEAGRNVLALVGMMIQMAYLLVLRGMGGGPFGGLFGGLFGGGSWEAVQVAHHVLRPLAAVLLMVGGFLLCRRSRFARTLIVVYALVAILLSVAFPILNAITSPPRFRMQLLFGPIWNGTTSLIYPVFLLIWFHRRKIRDQTRCWAR